MCLLIHGLLLHLFMQNLILEVLNLNLFFYYFIQDHSGLYALHKKVHKFHTTRNKEKKWYTHILEVLNLSVCG